MKVLRNIVYGILLLIWYAFNDRNIYPCKCSSAQISRYQMDHLLIDRVVSTLSTNELVLNLAALNYFQYSSGRLPMDLVFWS